LYCFAKKGIFPSSYKQFLFSALLTCISVFILSISVGQGINNWKGFSKQMKLNSVRLANGRIGFIYNFIWPKEVSIEEEQQNYEPRLAGFKKIRALFFSWQNLMTILTTLIIISIIRMIPRLDDMIFTILLGFCLFFLLHSTVRYYYAGLAGLPLIWHNLKNKKNNLLFFLSIFAIQIIAYLIRPHVIYCFVYNTWLSASLSIILIVTLLFLNKNQLNKMAL
jgi:hypothetical protein